MRNSMKELLAVCALVASVAMASALYAADSRSSETQNGTKTGSGMMNMMQQMSGMMDHCSQMMQGMTGNGTGKPNEQWRKGAPAAPDEDN